jgi:hypothetical protein
MSGRNKPIRKNKVFCAFCGEPPEQKNREHVLPRWLIELTGKPTRKVYLGTDYTRGEMREFGYSSLTVPACKECNGRYSELEGKIKPIILSMLDDGPVKHYDLHLLFDWFDKVRIGMWTWYYHIDKNLAGINPLYAIDQRLGLRDRALVVTKTSDLVTDLTFRGCNMPCFYYTPSCFNLMINRYGFTNISAPFIVSEALGLPYPTDAEFITAGEVIYSIVPGTETMRVPQITADFPLPCTKIFQPIWRGFQQSPLYDTQYARRVTIDRAGGIGTIFIEKGAVVSVLDEGANIAWVPPTGPNTEVSRYQLSKAVISLQHRIDGLAPSFQRMPEEERRHREDVLRTNREANSKILLELGNRWKSRLVLG